MKRQTNIFRKAFKIYRKTEKLLNHAMCVEIELALKDPNTKIMSARIPKSEITCPVPIQNFVKNISQTIDEIQATPDIELHCELNTTLIQGLDVLNNILRTIQTRLADAPRSAPNLVNPPTQPINQPGLPNDQHG